MKRCHAGCVLVSTFAAAFALCAGPAGADESDDPKVVRLFADWKKRQARFKNARYRFTGQTTVPKGTVPVRGKPHELDPNVPPQDVSWPIKCTALLDFASNRFRTETEENAYDSRTRTQIPSFEVNLFDGKYRKRYRPKERNPSLTQGEGGKEQPELGIGEGNFSGSVLVFYQYKALMFGHGSVPSSKRVVKVGELKVLPRSAFMTFHGQGVHKQRTCEVFRSRPTGKAFEEW